MERNEGMKKLSNLFRKKGEITYASGLVCPKTTALFFDKIWIPDHKEILVSAYGKVYENIPSEITFCENDLKKSICSSNLGLLEFIAGAPGDGTSNYLRRSLLKDSTFRESILNEDILANTGVILDDDIKEVIDNWSLDAFKGLSTEKKIMQIKEFQGLQNSNCNQRGVFLTSNNRNRSLMDTVLYFSRVYGIEMTPIFVEKTEFEKAFPLLLKDDSVFEHNAIDACIQAIPSVIEEQLSWKQVVETRKDKKAIAKMRKFKNWTSQNLEGKSSSEITDILCSELEDYEDALKKHGIKTAIGGFSTILSGTSSILAVIESSQMELAAAGIAVTAGLISFTSDQMLDYYEKKNAPIAFIYDVAKKVK